METGLRDRVVIVAAASQGLGRATAEAFAAEGARLAICSRNEKSISSVAAALREKHNIEALAQAVDVTDEKGVHRFVEAVAQKFGRVDACVTNSGGPPAKKFLALSSDEWRRAIDSNLLSVVYFARAVLPHMQRARWGRFVTITSVSVKQPIPDLVLSNAVRTAVAGLVRSLANEFGRDGITVNNVGPGYTATDRLKELAESQAAAAGGEAKDFFELWARDSAVGRLAEPHELASAIVFLASERAAMITGQTLLVDGGSYKGTF